MKLTTAMHPLQLLHIEDSTDDAVLILEELANGGFDVVSERVETVAEMEAALARGGWQLVISDFNLPRFSAMVALRILAKIAPELPCIIVSGAIGEEAAVALMKEGATDFVMKQRLSRLVPAVERSLRDAQTRREREQAIQAMRASEARLNTIAAHLPGVVFQEILDTEGGANMVYVSEGCRAVFGLEPDTLMERQNAIPEMILPEDRAAFIMARAESAKRLTPRNWEGRVRANLSGEIKWINLRASARRLPSGIVISDGIISNVTASKLAEMALLASQEQLRALASHVESLKEEERAHIAREIHDDLGATLTAAKIDLAWIQSRLPADNPELKDKVEDMNVLLDAGVDTARRISRRLRPSVLDHGIAAAIEWQAREFQKRTGIRCDYVCLAGEILLAPELSTTLFRIFQETLTNIARHAQARHVEVTLDQPGSTITLIVQDDGRGISIDDMNKKSSYGLRNMRERVDFVGGTFSISASAGRGTRIEVCLPSRAPARTGRTEALGT